MDLFLVVFGPSLLFWFLLALPKPGAPFFIALGFCALFAATWAWLLWSSPGGNSGPDNWYRGVPEMGFYLGLIIATGPFLAQIYRYIMYRKNKPTNYAGVLIFFTIFSFMVVGHLVSKM